jgi:hypothetical protein
MEPTMAALISNYGSLGLSYEIPADTRNPK